MAARLHPSTTRFYAATLGGLLHLAGCGSSGSNGGVIDGDAGFGDGGLDSGAFDDAGNPVPSTSPLVLTPADQVLTLNGPISGTLQFSATQDGRSISPVWSVDRVELGNIDPSTGLFTASGKAGGVVTITARYGQVTGTVKVTVQINWVDLAGDPAFSPTPADPGAGGFGGVGGDGPAPGATSEQQVILDGVPVADPAIQFLYPYNNTVMPRGLLAPVLQWADGRAGDFSSVRLHLSTTNFDYKGYFQPPVKSAYSNTNGFDNLLVPAAVWSAAALSAAGSPLSIELVFGEAAGAVGPYKVDVSIVQASLKGTVYYNSYGTKVQVNGVPLANSGEPSCGSNQANVYRCNLEHDNAQFLRDGPDFGAATLAIKPGRTAPEVIAGVASDDMSGCRVCHAVAAQGNHLITMHGDDYARASIYNLLSDPIAELLPTTPDVVYPAVYPDGSFVVSHAGASPLPVDSTSQVYSMTDLTNLGRRGLPETLEARLPVFSPDGKHMAFNYGEDGVDGDNESLAMVDYDPTTQTFGPVQVLYTPPAGQPVAWPSFTPDGKGIVFEVEVVPTEEYGFTRYGVKAELWYIDIATKTPVRLAGLNGVGSSFGTNHDDDHLQNFEPTVNPVVSGGYAWVVFTTRRLYGSIATLAPRVSDPRTYNWQDPKQITPKKLWVAALDLNPEPGVDPSHPAFYLPAQEIQAGNMRGYWVLDPCKTDGASCETGDECCGGYCSGPAGATTCSADAPTCAAEYDRCEKDEDCCGYPDDGIACINSICAATGPILY